MSKYCLTLLAFFVLHNVINTLETVLAFIKGAGLIQCCHPFWGYLTIFFPFLPGIVGIPWTLWQKKEKGFLKVTWDIAKWLAFPLSLFITNFLRFIKLCHLNNIFEPEYERIEIREMIQLWGHLMIGSIISFYHVLW